MLGRSHPGPPSMVMPFLVSSALIIVRPPSFCFSLSCAYIHYTTLLTQVSTPFQAIFQNQHTVCLNRPYQVRCRAIMPKKSPNLFLDWRGPQVLSKVEQAD